MAEHAATGAPELLLQVSLFTAEAAKERVESRPCLAPTGEDTETVHLDLERFSGLVGGPLVTFPLPEHPRAPGRAEVAAVDAVQIVPEQRSVNQVATRRMPLEPVEHGGEGAGLQENVAVHAQDDVGVRLTENEIADCRRTKAAERHVTEMWNALVESLEVLCVRPFGMVIEHQERGAVAWIVDQTPA